MNFKENVVYFLVLGLKSLVKFPASTAKILGSTRHRNSIGQRVRGVKR
jgi:hypothetical protein